MSHEPAKHSMETTHQTPTENGQPGSLRSGDLFGFWEWLKAKHPDLISDNSIGTLQDAFLTGVEWEKNRMGRELRASLSPREKARIAKGLPFMPGYMLKDDGTVGDGVYF